MQATRLTHRRLMLAGSGSFLAVCKGAGPSTMPTPPARANTRSSMKNPTKAACTYSHADEKLQRWSTVERIVVGCGQYVGQIKGGAKNSQCPHHTPVTRSSP